jgi:nucleoid-associated protein YgaU
MADRMSEVDDQKAEQRRDATAHVEAPAEVLKHVWTKEDTYASLAQKYYGSSQEPYWRLIYEQNKAIIGDHPNAIRVGMELVIPPLPDNLKKK